jgi:putative transposase
LGDFKLALRGLLGDAAPLSPASLTRLQAHWQRAYAGWKQRRLEDLAGVDVWAAGLSVQAGLEATTAALLVMLGALTNGQQVVLAVESGQRASQASGGAMLWERRARGLPPWRGTLADGPVGLWAAWGEPQPTAAAPRGCNHRLTTVLDAVPTQPQTEARTLLGAMPYADTPAAGEALRAQFDKRDRPLAPQAVERLACEWERRVTVAQCPREPWRHLRTTQVGESPLAAVRLRTTAAKRFKQGDTATAMLWQVRQGAETTFRRLTAPAWLPAVYAGVQYVDGLTPIAVTHREIAAWSQWHTYWQDLSHPPFIHGKPRACRFSVP